MPLQQSPYSLNCSVCGGDYFSKLEWHHHLTTEDHQDLARKECLMNGDKRRVKECCLVIFSSFSLEEGSNRGGGANKVIQYFSQNFTHFVTDFVWWEVRAHIGIVQFESRSKVEDILSSFAEIQIESDRVQVKRAVDLLDLEWQAILPRRPMRSLETETPIAGVKEETKARLKRVNSSDSDESEEENSGQQNIEDGDHKSRLLPPKNKKRRKSVPFQSNANSNGAVYRLINFSQRRHWGVPKFTCKKGPLPKQHVATVTINGVKYEPTLPGNYGRTKRIALSKAAAFCLDQISRKLPTPITPSSKSSKKPEQVDPYSRHLLLEVARHFGFKPPRFQVTKITAKKGPLEFSCRVTLNKVEYIPDKYEEDANSNATGQRIKCKSKNEARIYAAAFCLNKLTSIPSKF